MRYIRIHVNPKNNLHHFFLVQLIQRLLQLLKTCNTTFNNSLKPKDIFLYKNLDFSFSAGFCSPFSSYCDRQEIYYRHLQSNLLYSIFIHKQSLKKIIWSDRKKYSSRKEQWRIRKNIVLSNSTIAARIVIVQPINMNIVILFSIRHF